MIRPILVIEDDKKIARVVKIYLEEAGYRVIHAEKGKDAILSATKEKPLLVILDLMLPDIGGEQVIQELKALDDVPVIMLTSKASEDDRVAGPQRGEAAQHDECAIRDRPHVCLLTRGIYRFEQERITHQRK